MFYKNCNDPETGGLGNQTTDARNVGRQFRSILIAVPVLAMIVDAMTISLAHASIIGDFGVWYQAGKNDAYNGVGDGSCPYGYSNSYCAGYHSSTKSGATINNEYNDIFIAAIGALAFFVPHSVAAMSYDYRYMNGYNQGQSDRNYYYDNSACSHHHTWQYCEGYNNGYNNVQL